MNDLIAALRETITLLDRSEDSAWAGQSVVEMKSILAENIEALEADASFQRQTLKLLFAPTGSLQETAIDNGWPDEYIRLSSVVDVFTDTK